MDGLRGIAILCVLAVNCGLPFFRGGFIGVDLFFVLSGFLITALLTEEWENSGTISLRRFYRRRALRLLPALVVLLLACCLYAACVQSPEKARTTYRETIWVLFYFANWMLAAEQAVGSLDHAWSLSVEEQFYLVWPAVLCGLLVRGIRRPWIILLVVSLAAAAAVWRAFLWSHGTHYLRLYYGSDTRADALSAGCLLGLLFCWKLIPTTRTWRETLRVAAWIAILFLAAIGFLVPHDSPLLYRGGFTLIALGAAALILQSVAVPESAIPRGLSWPLLVWIGRISYSLYIWHWPVFQILRAERLAALGWSPALALVLRLAAVFGAACLSYYLVERPFLRLKRRLEESG
ncbi:MAG: acyltransferase [Verrucomicrobia bacterium]|nr:acyltransferase [Verrucomicrobiota bacterium]